MNHLARFEQYLLDPRPAALARSSPDPERIPARDLSGDRRLLRQPAARMRRSEGAGGRPGAGHGAVLAGVPAAGEIAGREPPGAGEGRRSFALPGVSLPRGVHSGVSVGGRGAAERLEGEVLSGLDLLGNAAERRRAEDVRAASATGRTMLRPISPAPCWKPGASRRRPRRIWRGPTPSTKRTGEPAYHLANFYLERGDER